MRCRPWHETGPSSEPSIAAPITCLSVSAPVRDMGGWQPRLSYPGRLSLAAYCVRSALGLAVDGDVTLWLTERREKLSRRIGEAAGNFSDVILEGAELTTRLCAGRSRMRRSAARRSGREHVLPHSTMPLRTAFASPDLLPAWQAAALRVRRGDVVDLRLHPTGRASAWRSSLRCAPAFLNRASRQACSARRGRGAIGVAEPYSVRLFWRLSSGSTAPGSPDPLPSMRVAAAVISGSVAPARTSCSVRSPRQIFSRR